MAHQPPRRLSSNKDHLEAKPWPRGLAQLGQGRPFLGPCWSSGRWPPAPPPMAKGHLGGRRLRVGKRMENFLGASAPPCRGLGQPRAAPHLPRVTDWLQEPVTMYVVGTEAQSPEVQLRSHSLSGARISICNVCSCVSTEVQRGIGFHVSSTGTCWVKETLPGGPQSAMQDGGAEPE